MASKVLRNGTILSFDDSTQSIKALLNASIIIIGDTISDIGQHITPPTDAEVIDVTGKILTPGFVNTHCHMWQTAFRTLAPNTTLASYFKNYGRYAPATKFFSAEDIYVSCLEGYYEGLNGGVTSFIEHAHTNWSSDVMRCGFDAAVDSGARVWWCHSVEDRDSFSMDEQVKLMESLGERTNDNHPLVSLGLAFDRVGSASAEIVEQLKGIFKELRLEAFTGHYLGGPWPVGSNGPAAVADKAFQDLHIPMIFSHGGFVTDADISALRAHDWFLAITPESEMHYGHGQQTSRLVQDQASLGIDTNFTFSGDILTQARLWLQSVRNVSYSKTLETGRIPRHSPMSVEDAFLLATRQGGRAVRRGDIGVLNIGAKADIVCFDSDSPNMAGWTDPVAAVVLHANVGDIEHVMVGGEFRKRDRRLILGDGGWAEFGKRFADIARRIQMEIAEPQPLGDKFLGSGEFGDVERMTTRK